MEIPNFITHYSRGQPFGSITAIPRSHRDKVIGGLDENNAWGLARFSDPEYLVRRENIERRMREEFVIKGGRPQLHHPIYFFLGRNKRFEEHELNNGYMIFLDDLSAGLVSFTYGDSMFSFNDDYRALQDERYQNSLCGTIFCRHELEDLFFRMDFRFNQPLHFEAQLWALPEKSLVKELNK